MSKIINKIINYLHCILFSKCRFWRKCNLFVYSGTCRSINAEGGYCGKYREYEKEKTI